MTIARSLLIVENEPLIAQVLADFTGSLGLRLAGVAASVGEALAILAQHPVDLAIVDVHLNNGEVCWPIADALASHAIPFFLVSADYHGPPPAPHGERLLLAKPYTLAGLEAALAKIIS
jgi:CheY-like chemotaxis protein